MAIRTARANIACRQFLYYTIIQANRHNRNKNVYTENIIDGLDRLGCRLSCFLYKFRIPLMLLPPNKLRSATIHYRIIVHPTNPPFTFISIKFSFPAFLPSLHHPVRTNMLYAYSSTNAHHATPQRSSRAPPSPRASTPQTNSSSPGASGSAPGGPP